MLKLSRKINIIMNHSIRNKQDDFSSKRVLTQLIYLIFISIGSKLLGFVREFVIANKLGTSIESDAYFLAITVSITFCGGILAAFSTSFIPIYSKVVQDSKVEGNKFINRLQTLTMVLMVAILLIFFLGKQTLFRVFFPRTDPQMIGLANRLASIMVFYVVASGVRTVVGGYLQYYNKTSTVYFVLNIVQNVVVIGSIVLYSADLDVLAYGYVLAGFIVAICLVVSAYKNGFSFRPDFNFNSIYVKEAIILTLPIFANQILVDINTFFDKSIASGLGTGIVSSLNYAYKINDIFVVTFGTTLATALYPEISKLIAAKEYNQASALIEKSMRQITLFLLPFSIMMLFYAKEIVELLLMRGAFNQDSANITVPCLRCYCLGMLFFAYRQILYRVMLSCHLTKKILINSTLTVGLNLALNICLSKLIGYRGVAIATTISMISMTIIMLFDIKRSKLDISLSRMLVDNSVYLIAAILSVGIMFLLLKLLTLTKWIVLDNYIAFIICALISLILYCVILKVRKDEYFEDFYLIIFHKIRKERVGPKK